MTSLALRLDAPFWAMVVAFALMAGSITMFGVAAHAVGMVG
jgi:hypothetical protein